MTYSAWVDIRRSVSLSYVVVNDSSGFAISSENVALSVSPVLVSHLDDTSAICLSFTKHLWSHHKFSMVAAFVQG